MRLVVWRDEMQDQAHEQRDRAGEVDACGQLRVCQDTVRFPQVTADDCHTGHALQERSAVRERRGVIVDVDDPSVRIVLPRQLVHISLCRQPRAYIYELAYVLFPREEQYGTLKELAVFQCRERHVRR